jgi:hypothetical protein
LAWVPLGVVGLELVEPGVDLAHSEAEFTADAEATWTAVASEVVQGLHGDTELARKGGRGQDRSEACLGGCCGRHTDQVREPCRG